MILNDIFLPQAESTCKKLSIWVIIDNIGRQFWKTPCFTQKGMVEWLKEIHKYLLHTSHSITFLTDTNFELLTTLHYNCCFIWFPWLPFELVFNNVNLKQMMRTTTTAGWLLIVLKLCRRAMLLLWRGGGGTPRPQAEPAKVVPRTVQGVLLVNYMI